MILDLLKYPEEADNKVDAVNRKADTNKTDKGKLIIAYAVPQLFLSSRYRAWRSWKFVVPRCTRR
jgi:hypothetical protein